MKGRIYDLRSDTVTRPSDGMRKAIYEADVGDDVYGEDPSVNRLQEHAAETTGKEDALFLTSGSMGNLIPLMVNCARGSEFLIDAEGHMLHYEMGSYSAIAGSLPVPIAGKRGILSAELLAPKLKPSIYYMTQPKLVVLENTHNRAGGSCYSPESLKEIRTFAREHALKVHMDGARVFNAAAATGVSVKEIADCADTITFCLSKGLGAPVGAVLCSTRDFIREARRVRKLLGGGMRQAGILAAAGLYALEHNVERLAEDHGNARLLAETLAELTWCEIEPEDVETNILFFDTPEVEAARISKLLAENGVLANPSGSRRIRMVTNLDLSTEDITAVCRILRTLKLPGS